MLIGNLYDQNVLEHTNDLLSTTKLKSYYERLNILKWDKMSRFLLISTIQR